jgi:hypothetical protein
MSKSPIVKPKMHRGKKYMKKRQRFLTLNFDEPSLSPPHSSTKTSTTSVSNIKLCSHITNHDFLRSSN